MSQHCVWLVIVGGCKEIEWDDVGAVNTFITDDNRLIMIIELGKRLIYDIEHEILVTVDHQESYFTMTRATPTFISFTIVC